MIIWIALILIFYLVATSPYFKRPKHYPPGPFPWPVIGNLRLVRNLIRKFGGHGKAFLELSRRYRSNVVAIRLGPDDIVLVSGNKAINEVLHSDEFEGRPWNEFMKLRNLGIRKGITMVEGPEWHEVRSWVVRKLRLLGFGQREVSDLISEELVEVQENMRNGLNVRMKSFIQATVINVLWVVMTGEKLQNKEKLHHILGLMSRRATAFDISGGILAWMPWLKYIAPEKTGYNLICSLNKELKDFLMEPIIKHKDNYVAGKNDDLINMFLHEMYSNQSSSDTFTEDQLLLILLDLFIAGAVTTTSTLDFLFLNMTINQEVQKRLHEEIDAVIGSDQLPTLNHRPRMPYVEAVLAESQRMCLVSPIIGPRRVVRDTTLMGYTIPEGTTVLTNIVSIHMDPEHFPDPEKFQPERFLKDGAIDLDERLIFFGKGRRRCPGEALARSALFLLFVGVMQKFRLLPVPEQELPSLTQIPGITISPKPYEVRLVPK